MALSQKVIDSITTPGIYQDKNGLSLKVRPAGTKSWIFRYQFNGDRHDIGLGAFPAVSLAEARKKVIAYRAQINQGIDPLAEREERSIAAITLQDACLGYIERHRAGWSEKHASQWLNSLQEHVFPVIGTVPVATVTTKQVLQVLDPIWQTKHETAARIRNRLERVIDQEIALGHRQDANPARWKRHLENVMPIVQADPEPLEAMDYNRLPFFMLVLDAEDSRAARCLQFLILTACRSAEAMGARWDEIDMINRVWTIPAERMKGGEEHQVPLSEEAIQVLKDTGTRNRSELVFPGPRTSTLLADNALRRLMKKLGENCTPHGFRSTFRTWADEKTAFPHEVCEISLAHVVGTATSRRYVRGNQLEKRRPLMAKWAKFAMDRVTPHHPVMGKRSVPESRALM